eukprot:SAG31_NODE_1238_length_9176_cov_9.589181_7_plen_45_part_00
MFSEFQRTHSVLVKVDPKTEADPAPDTSDLSADAVVKITEYFNR